MQLQLVNMRLRILINTFQSVIHLSILTYIRGCDASIINQKPLFSSWYIAATNCKKEGTPKSKADLKGGSEKEANEVHELPTVRL
jgi:hypothetical protein